MPTYTNKSRQHICINENDSTWKHKPHAGIEMHKQDTVGKGLLTGSLIGWHASTSAKDAHTTQKREQKLLQYVHLLLYIRGAV